MEIIDRYVIPTLAGLGAGAILAIVIILSLGPF